jgi:uncharacterized phage protein (TIGR01671 family)
MKENKFRIWDKYTKKMVDTGYHVIGETTVFGLINQYAQENPRKKEDGIEPGGLLMRYNDFVEMQFIGLKDKNGKEIYEGDIVSYTEKMHEHGDAQELKAEVMWCKDFAAWSLGRNNDWQNLFSDYGISKVEIIGNIFENPELLK